MTRELAIAKLKEIVKEDSFDCENDHIKADEILMELLRALGYEDVVSEYEKVHKWYG